MYKKIGIALSYLTIALLIYFYGESILAWFEQPQSAILVMIMATIMALFPIIPYPIVGGIIGSVYGTGLGGMLTWTGSTLASILMFLFVRYAYQDWGIQVLNKYKGLGKFTGLFERNAFLMILFARLIPIIPSIIINIYSALSRVSFVGYAIASSIGKIPAMLLFALIGDSLFTEPRNIIITLLVYGIFLAVTLSLYRLWQKYQLQEEKQRLQ